MRSSGPTAIDHARLAPLGLQDEGVCYRQLGPSCIFASFSVDDAF